VKIDNDRKQELLKIFHTRYSASWISVICTVIAFVGTAAFFYIRFMTDRPYYFKMQCTTIGFDNMWKCLSISGILTALWGICVTYIIVMWTMKAFLTIRSFKDAFTPDLRYQVLHSDSFAGFRPIGQLFLGQATILLTSALTLSLFLVPFVLYWKDHSGQSSLLLMGLGIPYLLPYLAAVPFLFWIPLKFFHSRMRAAKEAALDVIAHTVDETDSRSVADFLNLQKQLPEWPTGTIAFTAFASTILGSIVIPILTDMIKGYLK
jgi:hypothetical protein